MRHSDSQVMGPAADPRRARAVRLAPPRVRVPPLLVPAVLCLAGSSLRAGEATAIQVRLVAPSGWGPVERAAPAALEIRARRDGTRPHRLRVLAQRPALLGGEAAATLELAPRRVVFARIPILLPPGPSRLWEFPVRALLGRREVWRTDVRLTKAGPWHVVGPFPGNRAASHDRVFPPERGVRLDALYTGKAGQRIGWQPFPAAAVQPDGIHDLNAALGFTENAVAYVFGRCRVPGATPARLRLGSDDSVKVWHNGRLVHDHNLHRGVAPAQDAVALQLTRGVNTFLLKIVNDDGGWGFHFALDDGAGQPLPGLLWETGAAVSPLRDPELRLVSVTGTTVRCRWRSDGPTPARVCIVEADRGRRLVWDPMPKEEMVRPRPGARVRVIPVAGLTTRHRATVAGLKHGTRYLLWAEPALRGQRTERLAFYTAPAPGRTQFVRLRILAAVFTNATQQRDAERPGAQAPCPPAEVQRLRREVDEAVRFYWVNTGMRLALEVDYLFDDQFVATPNDNWYGVGFSEGDEERLRTLARRAGRRLTDYDGRLFITMEKRWDEGGQQWRYPASGGGTIGPESPPGMGKSAWWGGSDNAWLFCHEFGHQLDALYHHSLGPEYLFNHFQPWDGTAHRHGEHWDGNAWLLRWWGGYVTSHHQGRRLMPPRQAFRYLQMRWGRVVDAADADSDGIPDHASVVPLDEVRLGSSPRSKDTDGDGLDDMEEVMACQWVENGLDETWAGDPRSHRCDPRRPDTDRDGIPDGRDPYPLYPLDPVIRRGPPRKLARLQDQAGEVSLHMGWAGDALVFQVTAREAPRDLKLMLDADDDGWFVGGDNFLIRVHPSGGMRVGPEWQSNAAGTFAAAFHNCAVPGKWPFFDRGRLTPDSVQFAQETGQAGYACTIRVPRQPHNGLSLHAGERLGVLFAAAPAGGIERPSRGGMLTLFEPHTFVSLRLQ